MAKVIPPNKPTALLQSGETNPPLRTRGMLGAVFRVPRMRPKSQQRRPYVPFGDHVFVSLERKSLSLSSTDRAFRIAVKRVGLPPGPGGVRPTPHSLRHSFAVRALETCLDGRDAVTKHMLALSTYLGHSKVAHTYWSLEAVPELMRDIADRAEEFAMRRRR
jgi:integrase